MESFQFKAHGSFLNRTADLTRLHDWWASSDRNALAVYGRRRLGKSWLLREFAHDKPALVLVADRIAGTPQLQRFAAQIAPLLGGVQPKLDGVAGLIDVLYRAAPEQKLLVVIDEFPYLLPARVGAADELLTHVQAVMEERDSSQLKLVLCGSYIAQMERLLRGPLRGRLTPLLIDPLDFDGAQAYFDADESAVGKIERFAVAGGMSMYLDELGRGGELRARICERVLDSRGPLFNDPREVLEQELRAPGVYFSLLQALSSGPQGLGELGSALGKRSPEIQSYLENLVGMRLVARHAPVTAARDQRANRYVLSDGFMRFWFRFVFPYQEELRAGLPPATLFESAVRENLGDHVSPTFESICRRWVRAGNAGPLTRVGSWWGGALHEHRRAKTRLTEEIDLVALRGPTVVTAGECKWTAKPLQVAVLRALEQFKLPALAQAGHTIGTDLQIFLFSKSGFDEQLRAEARERRDVRLVDAQQLVTDFG